MKTFCFASALFAAVTVMTPMHSQDSLGKEALGKIAVINFKACVEGSKLGKQELARFEEQKSSLEKQIEAKEKELNDLAPKFSEEYLDTLTPEAEKELKNKAAELNQALNQLQNEYYNLPNQANYTIGQRVHAAIQKAARQVAKQKNIDMAINDDAFFYRLESLDISKEVITEMDRDFDASSK